MKGPHECVCQCAMMLVIPHVWSPHHKVQYPDNLHNVFVCLIFSTAVIYNYICQIPDGQAEFKPPFLP